MRYTLALSLFVLVASASVPVNALPTICVPPDTDQEHTELLATLTALGYTVVDSNDPATSNCDVFTAAYFNSNRPTDEVLEPWIQAGGLYIQMAGWPFMIDVAFDGISHSVQAELVVADRTHPMTQCLPDRWPTQGAEQYPRSGHTLPSAFP